MNGRDNDRIHKRLIKAYANKQVNSLETITRHTMPPEKVVDIMHDYAQVCMAVRQIKTCFTPRPALRPAVNSVTNPC